MPILETVATKALLTLATTITKKFAEKGWTQFAEEIGASFDDHAVRNYCKACNEYVNIRTLYSSQKDVFINDVYVPLYMSPLNDLKQKFEITNLNFYSAGVTSIIGRAGQGKSTFLRKMLINEFEAGKFIPVFFELKYFSSGNDLLPLIVEWFGRHNVDTNVRGIERLFKSGYIKLFLDGFDEMHPSIRDEALEKIKDFSRSYNKTTIIVTTRPDTVITTEPFISNYQVLDLEPEHIENLFLKISNGDEAASKEAMEQISNNVNIQKVASTPILAILLFLTFRAWSKIPDNLSDFYKKIFLTLLTHHDSLKPGKKINRGIDIPLNDFQIEDIFANFSFLSFSEDMDEFNNKEAHGLAEMALDEACYENVEPLKLVDIIKQCTGILCSNGYDKIVYSHKSLQEYFTAVYISRQELEDKKAFYTGVQCGFEETKYREVLSFLSGIDTKDYTTNYHLPCFKKIFEVKDVQNITDDEILAAVYKIVSTMSISYNAETIEKTNEMISIGKNMTNESSNMFELKVFNPIVFSTIASGINDDYIAKNRKDILAKLGTLDKDDSIKVPFFEVIESLDSQSKNNFEKLAVKFVKRIFIVPEHNNLVRVCYRKSQPSLLKKAFRKKVNPDSPIITY